MSPSNSAADTVDAIIHTAIMDVAVTAAIQAATAEFPWLNLPIIKQLFSWAVNFAFGFLDKYLERAAAFAVIDSQTGIEAIAYEKSVQALQSAQDSGDKNAVSKATQNFKDTLARLIHYDGG